MNNRSARPLLDSSSTHFQWLFRDALRLLGDIRCRYGGTITIAFDARSSFGFILCVTGRRTSSFSFCFDSFVYSRLNAQRCACGYLSARVFWSSSYPMCRSRCGCNGKSSMSSGVCDFLRYGTFTRSAGRSRCG
eukprot:g9163.t1